MSKKIKVEKGREESYEEMESTIRKKRGLFHEALKKKEVMDNNGNKNIIQTASNNQKHETMGFEVSERRKRGSLPEAQPINMDTKKF